MREQIVREGKRSTGGYPSRDWWFVQELVRCKDCKFYKDAGTIPNKSCCGFCTKLGAVSYYGVDAMDFCSFAERREP